jgi:hypothetical protein
VANFNLKEGLAPGAALLIDLTDEQIKGNGIINFETRILNLVFHSEPQKLICQPLLPVRVSGNFTGFQFTPTHRTFLGHFGALHNHSDQALSFAPFSWDQRKL